MVRSAFDRVRIPGQTLAEDPQRLDPSSLNKGVRLDASALDIPLGAAVDLRDCRFEERGIRQDFGYVRIGSPAQSRVLGLAEHKFIDSDELFHRLVRIVRDSSNNPMLEAWDGSSWVLVDTASETIRNHPLVMFSTQGRLVMTEGTQILSWSEEPVIEVIAHDFPSENELTNTDDEVSVEVAVAGAFNGEYTLNYSVSINGTQDADKTLTLGFYHEGDSIGERTYIVPDGTLSDSWDEESETFFRPSIEDGDELTIKIEKLESTTTETQDEFEPDGGADVQASADKSAIAEATGQEYTYVYEVTLPPHTLGEIPEITVGLYYRESASDAWILEDTVTFFNPSSESRTLSIESTLTLSDLDDDSQFGLDIEDQNRPQGTELDPLHVAYTSGVFASVKAFNEETDEDPSPGETHEHRTGTTSDFSELSEDAPKATFIFPFGDRLLALQDVGDPQKLSWSVDGDITDWTGEGSGSTSLLDARSDSLDDLVALGSVASNVAVLLRKRSMMRIQETGNPTLAIASEHWIEGIGTESPLSVKQVRDGIMFLGHDMMVYYFSGSGAPLPVGRPIHKEILNDVSSADIEEVEGVYDPVFGEYWLKLPSLVWVFDLGEFLETQELKWRSKDIQPQRLAAVSRIT